MRHRLAALARQLESSQPATKRSAFNTSVQDHLAHLASQYSRPVTIRSFTSSPLHLAQNRVQPSLRRPADFHTLLSSASSTNTLLLALFRTSTCTSCSHITPLLEELVRSRPVPTVGDKFSSIAFAELELDSPERDEGGGTGWTTMYDVGIEYGVRSIPTLIGFGGRRAERVTDSLADEKKLSDKQFMQDWLDEVMKKGDPHPSQGTGLFGRLFGG